jgi:parallel beta-helix repeat protein
MKKCIDVHALRIAVEITMLALLLAGSANAANLTVCPDGCIYSSIQKAINASSNGDTISVQSGTYFENVNVTKKIILRGIGIPVVDAGGNGSAITLAVDGITLEGFTVAWGWDGEYYNSTSAGIRVISKNNTITKNNATNNYNGIRLSSSGNTLKNNNASINDIGIFLESSNNNTLSDSNASNNDIGIFLESSGNNTLTNNNASSNSGNGISLYDSSNNTITGNNVSNNYDAGIYFIFSSSDNKIYNNIFNNTNNLNFYDSNINTWNTTRKSGDSIIEGQYLGGNFWANPEGKGFSQTCPDVNGDGICDQSHILNENNIDHLPLANDKIPPKSVSNLKNVSYDSFFINWTWTDPEDSDFDKVQIYINNKYRTSVLKGIQYYKTKKFYANTSYAISTRTVDKIGNVNLTWKNDTARTKTDFKPPMNVTNLKNISYAPSYINWTWKDPNDNDFKKVMVFIDSKFKGNVSKGKRYYNATNITANTSHTISTWTVDMNGNINKTWTNHSAWTAK